jgi:hypothetical protein
MYPVDPNTFCAIILQHFEQPISTPALRYAEQRWVHVLHARHPVGFNHKKMNQLGGYDEDYDKHLPRQLQGLATGLFNFASLEHTLHSVFDRPDLLPSIPFIQHLVAIRQCVPTSAELQQVSQVKLDAAIHILTHVSTHKLGITEIMHTHLLHMLIQASQQRCLLISPSFSFQNMLFLDSSFRLLAEKIDLNGIIHKPEVFYHWSPPAATSTHPGEVAPPCIAFKPAPPIFLSLCQNKKLATACPFDSVRPTNTPTQPLSWQALDTRFPCMCHQHPTAVNPQLGHILTCAHHLLINSPNLLNLLRRGPRFRCPVFVQDHEDVHDAFLNHIMESLRAYLAKRNICATRQAWANQWLDAVRHACTDALHRLSLVDLTEHNNTASQYTLYPQDLAALQSLRRSFAIITVDKASDLFAIVCKNHLYRSLLTDLSNSDFFNILPTGVSSAEILQQQLLDLQAFNLAPNTPTHHKLGYYMAIGKLHKTPPTFRFITSSKGCITERVSIYITRLLAAVQTFADQHFHDTLCGLNLPTYSQASGHRRSSWILKNSFELIPMIQHFNRHRVSHAMQDRFMAITVADFERLYTNIDLADCIHRITALTRLFFAQSEDCVLKVYFRKDMQPQWIPPPQQRHPTPPPGSTGKDNMGEFYMFDCNTFSDIFAWLMRNNFFEFGGRVFHQTKGIAMGSNASVLIANLYLFSYELEFIQQSWFKKPPAHASLQTKQNHLTARRTLSRSLYSARFIDDGAFIANKHIHKLLKQPPPGAAYCKGAPGFYGLHSNDAYLKGIYPHYLNITHSTSASEHFMDIHFDVLREPNTNLPYFITRIFDKRDFDLRTLPVKTYVHPHSDTALWCKLGVVMSQVLRFARLATDVTDFIYHTARLFCRMRTAGYSCRDLSIHLHRAVKRAARVYAYADPRLLELQIYRAIQFGCTERT